MSTEYIIYKKKDYEEMQDKLLQFQDMMKMLDIKEDYIEDLYIQLIDNMKCDNSYILATMIGGSKPVLHQNDYIEDSKQLLSPSNEFLYIIVDEYGKVYSYDRFLCRLLTANNTNERYQAYIRMDLYGICWEEV